MNPSTRRGIIRNIVSGLLVAQYHVPNFDFTKVFSTDFGFDLAGFDEFLTAAQTEINRQLTPEKWIKDVNFANDHLNNSVSQVIDAINAAVK
jgi:hypothetical protein